jgi:hypothetical protein
MVNTVFRRIYSFFRADWQGFDTWEDAPRIEPVALWREIEIRLPVLSRQGQLLKKDALSMVKGWPERTQLFLRKAQADGQLTVQQLHELEQLLLEWMQ